MNLKVRLAVMNFLEFAAWGAYLTCMGVYLGNLGMGAHIGGYFAMQGIVSIFMPALMGIVADRWIPAQRLLGLCHLLAGIFMLASAWYGHVNGTESKYFVLFSLYSVSVAFYMPTLALTNSVAYNALTKAGMDTVKAFPPIRIFGTIGFICTMWFVDLTGFNQTEYQFVTSGVVSLVLFLYSFTLPKCEVNKSEGKKSFSDALGLQAFSLFKRKEMAIFFIFSALLGASLQITNGFATPYIQHFETMAEYAGSFGVEHATILYSISQISETFCILLIPFFMKRYGIKQVMLIAMFAWVLRFGFLGLGNPGAGIWLFILSMIIYGMAFDFFNISGSLYVDKATDPTMRSSAQGLFILMTNGIGATVGSVAAQQVVNVFTHQETMNGAIYTIGNWGATWSAFSVYALIVGVLFALIFHPKKEMK
ncbi:MULTISPECIES: MFS transporter [unclassified Prevotella]|jgi:NHS family nucleoside permease-like MFS transporter|uniref:MFS transporter n=1 Tax=unclassified Prevotella TaxID=2638335 RepID=UPI0005635B20|nr:MULTISPECIES: MFS transporter [unclassified Prevotella]SEV83657.1 MFS transporter, NHS family, nucleoside permease [Prevotella sp. khp7]